MLRRLSSSLPTFKTLDFREGLNILVADRTIKSSETDTRNGAGKSSMIELLHFLLGGRADRGSLPMKPQLVAHTFSLTLDWPLEGRARHVTVSRRGSARDRLLFDGPISADAQPGLFKELQVSNAEWQAAIETTLFGLTGEHPCVSGRSMLSYYMRRASSHAFNTAVRHNPMQSTTDVTGNLCYLFGLNWSVASEYKDIGDKDSLRRKLKEAAKDPVLGRIVGNAAELRSQMAVAQQRVQTLERQLANFQVVPEYERLKAEADSLTAQLRSETDSDVIDRQNLAQLEEAIAEEQPPDACRVRKLCNWPGPGLLAAVKVLPRTR